MDSSGRKLVVVDNGSGVGSISKSITEFLFQFVKCGFGGSHFPSHIFPSMVGRPLIRSSNKIGNIEIKVTFFICFLCRTSVKINF